MRTIIKWQAPAYKISIMKIAIYILLIPIVYFIEERLFGVSVAGPGSTAFAIIAVGILQRIYKQRDPDANGVQLFFYHKCIADYHIEQNTLVIDFKNKKKIIQFDKINFVTTICPEVNKFYSSPDFSILYFVFGERSYKKYLQIFVPINIKEDAIKELSKYIKFYDKKQAEVKIKSNLLKYFGYIVVGGIVLLFLFFVIYGIRCSTYKSPLHSTATFWESIKTCSFL